jgi:hypothetical protein
MAGEYRGKEMSQETFCSEPSTQPASRAPEGAFPAFVAELSVDHLAVTPTFCCDPSGGYWYTVFRSSLRPTSWDN